MRERTFSQSGKRPLPPVSANRSGNLRASEFMARMTELATATFAPGAAAVSALHAQSNASYYEVAAINVTDQAGYEASGVVVARQDQGEWR